MDDALCLPETAVHLRFRGYPLRFFLLAQFTGRLAQDFNRVV